MKYEPQEFQSDSQTAFGSPLTVDQVWVLVKLVRHARTYCRNNAALHNYLRKAIPNRKFSTVTKTNSKGETYESLVIE